MGSRACFGRFFNDHNCANCVLRDACERSASEHTGAADPPLDDVKKVESAVGSVGAPVADVPREPELMFASDSYGADSADTPEETTDIPEEFNPDIHSTDDNGNPVYNKDGSLRKKRGRKPS